MKIRFIGCLYKSLKKSEQFESYFQTCLKTIQATKTLFPNSIFELHIDKTLNESEVAILTALCDSVILHQYLTSQRQRSIALFSTAATRVKNCDQLTKCMRLAPLFDPDKFSNQTVCVVIDIHDDFSVTAALIQDYLSRKNRTFDYILTKWKSTESDCSYDDALTIETHYHFDAGLVIAKKPFPLQEDISFEDFCIAKIFQSPSRLPKGVEEMLVDEYLKGMDFYEEYSKKIKWYGHTCNVDCLFINAKVEANSGVSVAARKDRLKIAEHAAPAQSPSNDPFDPLAREIYVCTQMPAQHHQARRRQRSL